ncbi:MAG: PP2C family protein-serine/threonine phosphatase [Candidatus Muiribacteriaceae bacterium]
MNFDFYALSDIGRVRRDNQDDYLVLKKSDNAMIAGVFDGVGGCDDGKAAAKCAVDVLHREFIENDMPDDLFECRNIVEQYLFVINDELKKNYNSSGLKLQTTGSILYMTDKAYFVSNVGDSPVFLIREGEIFQVTRDHNPDDDRKNILTQALGYPFEITPFSDFESVASGDVFIVCSDGLSGYLKKAKILEFFDNSDSIEDFVINMINCANSSGGLDNITAIAIRVS